MKEGGSTDPGGADGGQAGSGGAGGGRAGSGGPVRDEPSSASGEDVYYCDLCGAVMLNLHCKLICERCGYRRDCSDP